ncbi:MAG: aromatic ring-hydroxylating dioxygenase subunit alpha [Reyranellaceae bacterium]
MKREAQVALLRELFGYFDARATAQAERVMRNPVAAYTDVARWQQERRILFGGEHPLFVGLSCLLPNIGDYRVETIDRLPVLLTRDRDGSVKAFANICSHRGAPVAQGEGNARAFVCPYHGWCYGTDGRLLSISDERAFPGLRREELHLKRLPAGEKHGMIFVQPRLLRDGEAAAIDVDAHLAGMQEELAPFEFGRYSHFRSVRFPVAMNWKFVIDTFLESYHIAFLHKQTVAPIFHSNLSGAKGYDLHCRMTALRKAATDLRGRPDAEWGETPLKHAIVLYTLFPSSMFIFQADHVETWRVLPSTEKPDECLVDFGFYIPEPAQDDKAARYWTKNFELAVKTVQAEDFTIGAQMQQAFHSGAQEHVYYGRNEAALIHFHASVRRALGLPAL